MRDSGAIAVGVTGHRVVPDPERAGHAVDAILDRVVGSSIPVVWTSLAEGADRLVADRVLARAGARLVAVLPLDPDDYSLGPSRRTACSSGVRVATHAGSRR